MSLREKFTENANQFDSLMVEMLGHNETLMMERDALAQALEELCRLKIIKDSDGKTSDYLERQPKAWVAANQVLNTLEL